MDGNFWGALLKEVGSGTYKKDKAERERAAIEDAYKQAMTEATLAEMKRLDEESAVILDKIHQLL